MLYQVMTLVLESSYEALTQSMATRDPLLPDEGTSMIRSDICTLYETGFAYERVSIDKFTYLTVPKFDQIIKYHVLCQIGQGSHGKTILCSTSTGKLFAAKLFLIKASTKFNQVERDKEDDKRLKENYKKAKNERDLWEKLQPDYKSYCKVVTMNQVPALTMPFFPPVPKDKRKNAIPLIEQRLLHVAKEFGLHYGEIRWRHFGCRWSDDKKMKITLLDLGSLIDVGAGAGAGVGAEVGDPPGLMVGTKDLDKTRDGQKEVAAYGPIVANAIVELSNRMGTEENAQVKSVIP